MSSIIDNLNQAKPDSKACCSASLNYKNLVRDIEIAEPFKVVKLNITYIGVGEGCD